MHLQDYSKGIKDQKGDVFDQTFYAIRGNYNNEI
jgi:hypothetical protein